MAGFGNDVATIGAVTASGDVAFEDDVLPTVAGPITAAGLTLTGPTPGGAGGSDPVGGMANLILDASISVTGTVNLNSPAGIVQLGGTVGATGDLTLTAANGIVQSAGSLESTGGNLALTAGGAIATSAAGATATGISFAGTLSAATGTASLVASAGDISESQGARLIADTLTGSATAGGDGTGQASFGIAATAGSGNDVGTLGAFTTGGGLALEDDVLPTIAGPLTVGGALTITGPTPGGAGGTDPVPGAPDLLLDADITAASASFDSFAGIIQLGGAVQTAGDLALSAANGIIQAGGSLTSTGGNLGLDAGGAGATVSNGVTASGIAFAGTLSAVSGTATLIASARRHQREHRGTSDRLVARRQCHGRRQRHRAGIARHHRRGRLRQRYRHTWQHQRRRQPRHRGRCPACDRGPDHRGRRLHHHRACEWRCRWHRSCARGQQSHHRR